MILSLNEFGIYHLQLLSNADCRVLSSLLYYKRSIIKHDNDEYSIEIIKTRVAKKAGISITTCYRSIQNLVQVGYLKHASSPNSCKRYYINNAMFNINN